MSIIPEITNGETKTIVVAITASFIGIVLGVVLLSIGLIGEVSFVTLFIIISLVGLFIAFSPRVESINLKELTLTLAKVQEIQQAVIAKEAEPNPKNKAVIMESYVTDPKTDSVIKAIGSSSYTFRNIGGITRDANMPINEVENALNWLLVNKLATESSGVGGSVYSLSPKGFNVFSSLLNSR